MITSGALQNKDYKQVYKDYPRFHKYSKKALQMCINRMRPDADRPAADVDGK